MQGFVVLKGSYISPKISPSVSDYVKTARENAKISSENILLEDVLLETPSAAAVFVIGNSANGWDCWKTKDGTPLKEFKNNSVQKN